jgi:iron complex outermembrane receptor protein
MKPIHFGCIAASLLLISTTAAIAKTPDTTIKLKTVTVEGNKKDIYSIPIFASKKSLTANSELEAKAELKKNAGGVSLVSKKQYENTKASNFKEVLEYVPGVFVQTRYGEESRVSIRGTGLSRTFHLRGLRLLQDGIPMNLADGSADFQELDPSAYDHIEVCMFLSLFNSRYYCYCVVLVRA